MAHTLLISTFRVDTRQRRVIWTPHTAAYPFSETKSTIPSDLIRDFLRGYVVNGVGSGQHV